MSAHLTAIAAGLASRVVAVFDGLSADTLGIVRASGRPLTERDGYEYQRALAALTADIEAELGEAIPRERLFEAVLLLDPSPAYVAHLARLAQKAEAAERNRIATEEARERREAEAEAAAEAEVTAEADAARRRQEDFEKAQSWAAQVQSLQNGGRTR